MTRLPGVTYGNPPRAAGPALIPYPPRGICLHNTGNRKSNAWSEAGYAHTRDDPRAGWTSAHFYVDSTSVIGSVPLDQQAWAAYDANAFAWHVEMAQWWEPSTLSRTAHLFAQLAILGQIPAVKLTPGQLRLGNRGMFGHWDVTQAYQGDHDDPGPDFGWSAFLDQVRGYLPQSARPVARQGEQAMHVATLNAGQGTVITSPTVVGGSGWLHLSAAFGDVPVRVAMYLDGWAVYEETVPDMGRHKSFQVTDKVSKITVQHTGNAAMLSVDLTPDHPYA